VKLADDAKFWVSTGNDEQVDF
jgi:hypothetical protein